MESCVLSIGQTLGEFEAAKEGKYGDWYYEVTTDSPWNYCFKNEYLTQEGLSKHFTVEKIGNTTAYPWNVENAPITIKTKAHPVKGWTLYRGSTGKVPFYTQMGIDFEESQPIELIPYGCTTLRITEFPVR